MSDTRDLNMAKINASVQEISDQDTQDISRVETQNTDIRELSTQRQITRLEKALEIAKSDSVKAKLRDEIQAAKLRKEEEERRKKEELETIQKVKTARQIAGNVATGVSDIANSAKEKTQAVVDDTSRKIATISTPGGLWLPIAVLFIFFILIIPVNGQTRIQWLWSAITSTAHIGKSFQHTQEQSNTTASGDVEQQQPGNNTYQRVTPTTNPYIRRNGI